MKQQFTLAPIFTDNMVFQANKPIKVFGKCKKGSEIIVSFPHQVVKIKTKNDFFNVEISPLSVMKQGFSFSVSSRKQEEVFYNCLVGEVFLLLGEGNMKWPLEKGYTTYIQEVPYIRYFEPARLPYPNADEEYPEYFSNDAKWQMCNQSNATKFSAIGYFMSIGLFENLKCPIGIILIAENDSSVFTFIDEQEFISSSKLRKVLVHYQAQLDKYQHEFEYNHLFEQELKYHHNEDNHRSFPMGPKHCNRPSGLFNRFISSVYPFVFKGICFYQGESDWESLEVYDTALSSLIKSFRTRYDDASLPFIYTQIAGYRYPGVDSNLIAKFRVVQQKIMNPSDSVYMASAIDLGEVNEIYPKDKFPIAERLTNLILEKVYKIGKNTLSPNYFSYQVHKDKIVILTEHNSLNLVSKSMQNLGFFCSYDRVHFDECPQVKIMNNQIVIENPKKMKAIRYGYDSYPLMDIYSSNGLPLLPFSIFIDYDI